VVPRDPKVAADIRVVAIGDFDFSPCGGTHCARTSQLGAIRIVGAERYKGMTRITFVAGKRGRTEMFTRDHVLRSLATQFSCGTTEVPGAIDKLRASSTAATAEITALRGRLADAIVATFGGTGPVVAAIPGDVEILRSVAAKLANAGRDAIVCAPDDAGAAVVLFRAAGSSLDCGELWKQLVARVGGRGGGKADRAEGRLAAPIANWPALLADLGH
jgi:alanyl-tRNA synthetase